MKTLIHPVRSNLHAIGTEPLLENEPSAASAQAAPDVPLPLASTVGGVTTSDFSDIIFIYGTEGDDVITWQGVTPVVIQGLGGNDQIYGPAGGNSYLSGDAGNDTLHGYGSGNSLFGGADNDTLFDQDGANTLDGGAGNDTLDGGAGVDIMRGGADNDTIVIHRVSGSLGEIIDGGDGIDRLVVSDNNTDPFLATISNMEELFLNSGVQNIDIISDSDELADFDTITHQDGSGAAFSITAQNAGTYSLAGKTITGILTLNGSLASLVGDTLIGSSGNEILNGRAGFDTLVGGLGGDYLVGGKDADIFKYSTVEDSQNILINGILQQDQIGDFTQGQDKIDLSAIDADPGLAGDQAFVFVADPAHYTGNWTGVLAQITWGDGTASICVSTDADPECELIIYMSHPYQFTASDFIL